MTPHPPPPLSHCGNLRCDISAVFKMVGEASYVKFLAANIEEHRRDRRCQQPVQIWTNLSQDVRPCWGRWKKFLRTKTTTFVV